MEEAIEAKREEIRTLGVEVENIPSEQLFQVDISGDAEILNKKKLKGLKPLKADEIIANKSKVPGLVHVKKVHENKKFQGVSGKEAHSLMKLAGRVQGVTGLQGALDRHGLSAAKNIDYDVWEEGNKQTNKDFKKKPEIPEILKTKSITSYTHASKIPKTLLEKPITVKEMEVIPHAGKSYNPSLISWKDLINQEFYKEKSKEDQRIELEKYQERIKELIATIDDNEEQSDSEQDDENEGKKDKILNDSSDEESDEEEHQLLSINKPVKVKKKTKSQRNRLRKHQERMKLEQELKELKKQITELQRLKNIEDEVNAKQGLIEEEKQKEKKRKHAKLGTKYHVMNDALEVKLSDELNDSLRKLKPEGNLFYDQLRTLQSKGKVESRLPVKKKRRYAPKVTEKWTYKDFK